MWIYKMRDVLYLRLSWNYLEEALNSVVQSMYQNVLILRYFFDFFWVLEINLIFHQLHSMIHYLTKGLANLISLPVFVAF